VTAALPDTARGKPLEIWFQDEARIGQQGTLTRRWAKRGSRPGAPRDRRYTWCYLFGAACPARGVGAALVMPHADTEAHNKHLVEIARTVAPGAHAVVIQDGAGYHTARAVAVPDNITIITIPPYTPELNAAENIWQWLRQNKLSNRVFDDYKAILDATSDAWNDFLADPAVVTSVTTRNWAKVSI
jgi:hypothetical protein